MSPCPRYTNIPTSLITKKETFKELVSQSLVTSVKNTEASAFLKSTNI